MFFSFYGWFCIFFGSNHKVPCLIIRVKQCWQQNVRRKSQLKFTIIRIHENGLTSLFNQAELLPWPNWFTEVKGHYIFSTEQLRVKSLDQEPSSALKHSINTLSSIKIFSVFTHDELCLVALMWLERTPAVTVAFFLLQQLWHKGK